MNQRFNLIERLQLVVSSTSKHKGNNDVSLERGDIAGAYRKIYDVANSLASSEGLMWIQIKFKQDTIDKIEANARSQEHANAESLPPLLETQLWEYLDKKRQEYLNNMKQLMELYIKSRWAEKRKEE
ncbi:hypothetical protein ACFLYE_00940 [Chloroflexota bacterium]